MDLNFNRSFETVENGHELWNIEFQEFLRAVV
jgi:hypothetical protein